MPFVYKIILNKSKSLLQNNNFFKNKDYNTSFELVSLFLILYIKNNINKKNKNFHKINESLISIFISDLDESLRTKGIGDMSIGKYVKKYVKKFYFRLSKFPEIKTKDDNSLIIKYLHTFDIIKENQYSIAAEKLLLKIDDIINLENSTINNI